MQGKKRIILGITGSFGSGKTTVAGMFKSFGAEIIDADIIAHRIIGPKTKVYKRIINAFGKGIANKDATINRDTLAEIVFDNKNLLRKLNRIIHPEVIRIINHRIKSSKKKLIVIDAPLLIEAGLHKIADKLIVVKASRQMQIKRLQKKLSINRKKILKRIGHQIPLREKLRLADFVIDNNKRIGDTRKEVKRIRRLLWKN